MLPSAPLNYRNNGFRDLRIESIIEKYQTTKEELQNYNDLTNVKVGSKLIIPCASRE